MAAASLGSFDGRRNRKSFITYYFGLFAFILVVTYACMYATGLAIQNSMPITSMVAFGVLNFLPAFVLFVCGCFMMVTVTQRFHDLNKSGWWTLLWIFPVTSILVVIYLCCKKGTTGPNLYGPDPLEG